MMKRIKRIVALMLLILMMAGMIGEAMPSMAEEVEIGSVTQSAKAKSKSKKKKNSNKPRSVSLSPSGKTTMLVGSGMQLTATLHPETAKSGLKWKSSNKKVARVSANGWVTSKAPGTTTITVTTRNKKKAKVKIRVIDDGKQPIAPPAGYDKPYVLYVCVKSHTIAAIAKDDNGEWTRVVRMWPTGTGRKKGTTDIGFWWLTKKERWHRWGSGYSPFANKLNVGIYLHGPIYKKKNRSTIRPSYYNCIGTNCSSGCIRTVCGCAQWVYYNCPVGTYVIVAQNSRFSTPRPKKIGKKAKKDPTDMGNNVEIFMTGFSVDPGAITMGQGAVQRIALGNFAPANTSTNTFTFTSDNPGVAQVSAEGDVVGVSPGSATITVTANDDLATHARIPVTVVGNPGEAQFAEAEEAPSQETLEDSVENTSEESVSSEESALIAEEITVEETAAEVIDEVTDAEAGADAVIVADPVGEEADPAEDNGLTAETEPVDEEMTEIIVEEE